MLRYGRYDQPATYLLKQNDEEDISNPLEVTERKIIAVENIVDKNKYLTLLFFSQHYTHLDTCPKYHQYVQFNLFPAHINISYSNDNMYIICRKRGGQKTVLMNVRPLTITSKL